MQHPPRNIAIDWLNTIWETDLPTYAKIVACNLRRYMNSKHDMAWPSVARVAGECGMSESQARRMLQLLVSEGWLINNGRSAVETKVYQATFPEGVSMVQGVYTSALPPVQGTPELNNELNKTLSKGFKPPTVVEVKIYCDERGNTVDPETFVDFNTSKGWMIGKNKMKDWKAAIRTWEKRENDNTKGSAGQRTNTGRLSGAGKTRAAREAARERERG